MSGVGEAAGTTARGRHAFKTLSRGRKALWAVQIVLGVDFVVGGVLKLVGQSTMVDLFDRIGAGEWLRYLVGAVELAGGIGVLIPALAGLAACGLCMLLVAAAYTNVFVVDDPPWVPLIWLVLVAIVAWQRRREVQELIMGPGRRHADSR